MAGVYPGRRFGPTPPTASATRNLTEGVHPARWHRLFWAVAVGVLPITLLFIGQAGGATSCG